MSSQKQPSKAVSSSRLPAPSLFVPPSRNDSNTSLVNTNPAAATQSKATLQRQQSLLGDRPRASEPTDLVSPGTRPSSRHPPQQQQQQQQQQQNPAELLSSERTDALWAEMQNTLEEVELSATNPVNVFGPEHAKALEELRTAQIALAQAWARSEAEEENQKKQEDDEVAVQWDKEKAANLLTSDRIEKLNQLGPSGARQRSTSVRSNVSDRTQLEEDTENDIRLARKRREANDRYFQRVSAGVLDVVAKLDEVARAMKVVEQDSKDIWADNESIKTASTAP